MRTLFIAGFIAAPIYIACRVFVAWISDDVDDFDDDWPFEDEEDEGAFLT